MKHANDISNLITDKEFHTVLREWNTYSTTKKAVVCREYNLSDKELSELYQIWYTLDFNSFEISPVLIENAFDEMVWKLANKKVEKNEKKTVVKLFNQFARIAAVLILPILIYAGYLQFYGHQTEVDSVASQLVTVACMNGTISNLTLPDGSSVWLNSGSTISYPNIFNGDSRQVTLTGEAYFEVVKNRKVPMVVSIGNVNVKVYGTTFNVNAFGYASEKSVKVTLVEGLVALSTPLTRFDGNREFFIKPGQTVTFREDSKKFDVKNEDTLYYTSWKDGVLIFRDTDFKTVLERLSRKFNVDIELKDKKLASVLMDATFKNESLDKILQLLSLSTPFTFRYKEPKKLADGSFEKSKIYIENN